MSRPIAKSAATTGALLLLALAGSQGCRGEPTAAEAYEQQLHVMWVEQPAPGPMAMGRAYRYRVQVHDRNGAITTPGEAYRVTMFHKRARDGELVPTDWLSCGTGICSETARQGPVTFDARLPAGEYYVTACIAVADDEVREAGCAEDTRVSVYDDRPTVEGFDGSAMLYTDQALSITTRLRAEPGGEPTPAALVDTVVLRFWETTNGLHRRVYPCALPGDPGRECVSETVDGVATFPAIAIDLSGDFRMRACVERITEARCVQDTPGVPFVLWPAFYTLRFRTQPGGAVAGAPFATQPVVEILDRQGNLWTRGGRHDITLTVAGPPGTGARVIGTATAVATNGVATFADAGVDRVERGVTLIAGSTIAASATSAPFDVAGPVPASIEIAAGDNQTAAVGRAVVLPPTVVVRTASGAPAPDVEVTFAPAAGSGTVTGAVQVTDAAGRATVGGWTLGTAAGTNTLRASVGVAGVAPAVFTATATPDMAFLMTKHVGDNQEGVAGVAVAVPPAVVITDQFGNPVPRVPVTFAVASGGGSVSPAAPVPTDARGIASPASWTLGPVVGAQTLIATSPGVPGSPQTFTATAAVGAAARVRFVVQPSNVAAGSAIAPAVQVAVQDAFGNPRLADSSTVVSIDLGANPGGSQFGGPQTATAVGGVATFPNLSVNAPGEGYTFVATAGGLTSDTSDAFTVVVGEPMLLALIGGPAPEQVQTAATPIAPPLVVEVRDAGGNRVTASTAAVTLYIVTSYDANSLPTGGTLSGTITRNAVAGVATFDDVHVDVAGNYVLGARAAGLAEAASGLIRLAAGAPATAAANDGDGQTAAAGTTLPVAPSVIARDAGGNPVSGVAVTFAVSSGGGSIAGAAQTTDATGVARVGGWTLGPDAGANTLTATVAGSPAGSPVTFTATGTITLLRLAFVQQPGNTLAMEPIAPPVRVVVLDGAGQIATAYSGSVTVALGNSPFDGTLTGTLTRVAVNGVATFDDLRIDRAAAGYTLRATAASAEGAESTPFDINAGSVARLEIVSGDGPTVQTGEPVLPSPVVRVVDAGGNGIAGVSLLFYVTSGGGYLTGNYTTIHRTTDADGYAQLLPSQWLVGSAPGPNTLTARLNSHLEVEPAVFTATAVLPPFAAATISGGYDFTCATSPQNVPYCWGTNEYGKLGDGTNTYRERPTQIGGGLLSLTQISAGLHFACGLATNGAAYCWGANHSGQLGNGTLDPSLTPMAVRGGHTFTQISAGATHACALTEAGQIYCWGGGYIGANATNSDQTEPVPVGSLMGLRFTAVSAGGFHTCALDDSGRAYCWGDNLSGQVGDGTSERVRTTPTRVAGGLTFTRISGGTAHSCGISAGSVWCWGDNTGGQLGTGESGNVSFNRNAPVRALGALGTSTRIAAGSQHSCSLNSAGEMYCWGLNTNGQLGDGSRTPRATAVQVAGGISFANITVGSEHSCAVRQNGAAYCWGYNSGGRLGIGTFSIVYTTQPTAVASP